MRIRQYTRADLGGPITVDLDRVEAVMPTQAGTELLFACRTVPVRAPFAEVERDWAMTKSWSSDSVGQGGG